MRDEKVLQISNLTKNYKSVKALKGVSLDVSKGEIVGLVGQNGAGKSTMMGIVTGLIYKYEGTVLVNAVEVNKVRFPKKMIGSMIENPTFFEGMTGMENLKYCCGMGKEKFDYHKIERYASLLEMDDVLDRKVKTYSVGMKKKLDLLQAVYGEPELLLLDEPTSGLDPYVIPAVRDIVEELAAKGSAIMIASHQLPEIARVCDRVVMIHKGTILDEISIGQEMDDRELESLFIERVNDYVRTNM